MADLFISHAPVDTGFAAELRRELARREFHAVLVPEDGEHADAWEERVVGAIRDSSVLVFVITPESLGSERRRTELATALANGKRVIPLVRTEPHGAVVPPELARLSWLRGGSDADPEALAEMVVKALRGQPRSLGERHRVQVRRRRRRWREDVRPYWLDAREPLLALSAGGAVVLGIIGYLQAPKQGYGFFDALYRTLQLFGLGGATSYKAPVALQIARLLAPLALGFAALQGVLHLFRDEFQVLRIRFFARRHVVIVGLGAAGVRLVKSFNRAGWKVVAVECDPLQPNRAAARDLGVPVLTGDGREASALRRARIERAQYMVVTTGDDGVNFDVAMSAADRLPDRRRGVLTVFAHVEELHLWRALKAQAVAAIDSPGFRLELFNIFFTAAHLMVDEHPPFMDADGAEVDEPHVCIVGMGGVSEGLILRIVSRWRERERERKLRLTLAGPAADEALSALLGRYPELVHLCEMDARSAEIASAGFQRGSVLLGASGDPPVTRVYVSLPSQGESLAAALALNNAASTVGVPVVVALDDDEGGTGRALRGCEGPNFARGVEPFGVLSRALTPALTVQGMNELIARARHSEYVADHAAGMRRESAVPWDQLAGHYKEANRRFADGIGAALAAVGCEIAPAPLIDADGDLLSFSGTEVEMLARLEHERWAEDLRRDGWHYGPERDAMGRTHPMLVPWERLPDRERAEDRESMRELPRMLARLGLELYRPGVGRSADPAPMSASRSGAGASPVVAGPP